MREGKAKAESAPRVAILGLGNTLMGDDGVGVRVVEDLKSVVDPRVACVTGWTAGMALIPYFLRCDLVIVVDAISAHSAPGTIFRFGPDEGEITRLRSHNSHGMGISYLVTAARMKGADPQVLVFAIQVGDVGARDREFSPPVAEASRKALTFIVEELRARGFPPHAEPRSCGSDLV
jgi:hydrogenase maturation protease